MADNMTWTSEQKQVIDLRTEVFLFQRQQEAERRQYSYSEL